MKVRHFALAAIAVAFAFSAPAFSQTPALTFTLETTNPDGKSLIPRLTWATTPTAASCTASGAWSGVKIGSGTEILAAVTSSKTYTLSCTWPGQKSATVKWTTPTKNTDGSTLTDLAGFKVLYGSSSTALTQTANVSGATSNSWTSPDLAVGTWYFAAVAVTQSGIESSLSNIASKAIAPDSQVSRSQVLAFTVPNPVTITVE